MSAFEMSEPDVVADVVAVPDAMVMSTNPWTRRLIELGILVLALLIGLTIRFKMLEPAVVISKSMLPTLPVNTMVLTDIRDTQHGNWQRGEVIIFNVPESWKTDEMDEDTIMKRIVGLPGETVRVDGFGTYINGQQIAEPYIAKESQEHDPVELTLGDGEYFVMGDNRNNSDDSRDHGPIHDDDIRGRAFLQVWPLNHFGRLPRPDYANTVATPSEL